MITIEISEEVNNVERMIDCLEEIIRLLKIGYTSGIYPTFNIEGQEEKEELN